MKEHALQTLIDELLADQRQLTAVERFSSQHDDHSLADQSIYRDLIPVHAPGTDEQYAFEVDLDACSGCKACVAACHSQNGLDESESWRDVGTLVSKDGQASIHQTVTTACHHCEDPACLNGCPTRAYEKELSTGIVRHLDDQCIGCRYCELKCPYEVPKYNKRLGIVRKCDMCYGRLEQGEAPACVQACPSEAIKIRVVTRGSVNTEESLVAGSVSNQQTLPTTTYLNQRTDAKPIDDHRVKKAHSHLPLVIMLVMTQTGIGILMTDWITRLVGNSQPLAAALPGAAIYLVGLGASIAHLGQPMKAWKAFLGWRTSWLSREILTFGALAGLIALYITSIYFGTGTAYTGAAMAFVGLLAVWTSVMVYADTLRSFWRRDLNTVRFACTTLGLGLLSTNWPQLALIPIVTTLALDWNIAHNRSFKVDTSAKLLQTSLSRTLRIRICFGGLALLLIPLPPLAFIFFLSSELVGRYLFFTAVDEPSMPGL